MSFNLARSFWNPFCLSKQSKPYFHFLKKSSKFGIGSLFSGEQKVKFHEILFIGGEIGETPLHISARIGEARGEKCTKMLLKSGADTNLAMTDGRTPLHIAAECGSLGKCSI